MFSPRGGGPGITREFDSIFLSRGWRIVRNLTKLMIPRVGMFDRVAEEPGT